MEEEIVRRTQLRIFVVRDAASVSGHYADIETVGFESSFFAVAAASACATACWAWAFFSSSSFTFFSRSAALCAAPLAPHFAGLLNLTLLLWLCAPRLPVSGVGTLTSPPLVDRPRWNEVGKTRPSGCWNGHVAFVHAVPNLHGCWTEFGGFWLG